MVDKKKVKTEPQSWNDKLRGWRQEHADAYARTLLMPPTPVRFPEILPRPGVVQLMGDRGGGKSGTAHAVAHDCHTRLAMPRVLHIPHATKPMLAKVKKLVPEDMMVTNDKKDWPAGAVIIFDEAAQGAHARRAASGDSVELDNTVSISRQRGQLVIFIAHHSRKLDLNIITDCSQVWWKNPSYAHMLFERDQISDFTMKAFDYFSALRHNKPMRDLSPQQTELVKSSTLVLDMGNFHFSCFRNKLPPYWTEELSNLFSDIHPESKRRRASRSPRDEGFEE